MAHADDNGLAPAPVHDLPELFPFVFFGCWNQPGMEGSVPPRDKVFEAVAAMDDIKAIVIGGDNVYPRPLPGGVKNKIHEIDVSDYKGTQPMLKIARNLVDYEAGRTIFETVLGMEKKSNVNQVSIFDTIT